VCPLRARDEGDGEDPRRNNTTDWAGEQDLSIFPYRYCHCLIIARYSSVSVYFPILVITGALDFVYQLPYHMVRRVSLCCGLVKSARRIVIFLLCLDWVDD
jgi:hypothetical protein